MNDDFVAIKHLGTTTENDLPAACPHGSVHCAGKATAEDLTVEEYMQWVRHEAMQCPQVIRVEVSPEVMAAKTMTEAESRLDQPQRSKVSYMDRLIQHGSLSSGPDWAQPSSRLVIILHVMHMHVKFQPRNDYVMALSLSIQLG